MDANAKKMVFMVIMVLFLAGCSIPGAIKGTQTPAVNVAGQAFGQAQVRQQANGGTVPIVFVNPSNGVYRHVWLFEGNNRVESIPDSRGGWMFNRPAMAEFKIQPAYSREWHSEVWLNLPRNTTFRIYEQAERIVFNNPVGQPHNGSFKTGKNPTVTIYHKQSPTQPQIQCGGVVHLPYRDSSGPDQFRPVIEFNPGAVWKQVFITGGGR